MQAIGVHLAREVAMHQKVSEALLLKRHSNVVPKTSISKLSFFAFVEMFKSRFKNISQSISTQSIAGDYIGIR